MGGEQARRPYSAGHGQAHAEPHLPHRPLRHDHHACLVLLLARTAPCFGYAKPVPINPYNFQNPKKGMALSSVAGPAVNIIMAVSFAFLLRVVMPALEGLLSKAGTGTCSAFP